MNPNNAVVTLPCIMRYALCLNLYCSDLRIDHMDQISVNEWWDDSQRDLSVEMGEGFLLSTT